MKTEHTKKTAPLKQSSLAEQVKSVKSFAYPAVADSVNLTEITLRNNKEDNSFILESFAEQQSISGENTIISNKIKALKDSELMALLAPIWPVGADSDITVNIIARRTTLLKIKKEGGKVVVEAHWNLFIPYFHQIKELPIAHSEILGVFANAAFHYVFLAIKHSGTAESALWRRITDEYRTQPDLLLTSLDIFNKPNIYHIHPTRTWLDRIYEINDRHHLQIDVSAVAGSPGVSPVTLEEVTNFIHKIVKNYAFRYVDYLWTQRYKICFSIQSDDDLVACEGNNITINIHALIGQANWKPALYLCLGHAIMLAILRSSGATNEKENIYLALMKTWNRYLSFDESTEQQSVRELYGLSAFVKERLKRCLLENMIGKESVELVDDFTMLIDYSAKETFEEKMKIMNKCRLEDRAGAHYERLWNSVRNANTHLMRNNISYSKLIEVLRNDNIDHTQLSNLLLTGNLGNRNVVDVSEWLLLRTLLYDLINAPKVFKNDYKMLLKVLTKVNKGLIIYIWTLILDNDVRYELINGYISKLITDIFVFDRVKIYEIVADPVECLEAEAVSGYLLNWAGLSLDEWRSITGGALSRLPRNVVTHLRVQTASDVDQLVHAMTIRASGLIGFYLHQAYRWGSTEDALTERIRSYSPDLLRQAQKVILPGKINMGGAMLLLVLAQIISDARDGFAGNIVIIEKDKQSAFDLIRQCLDWNQRHFVMMVAGIAAGYMGDINGWILQQFDTLLERYGGGDRVVLRSVVQFDVDTLIERALITTKVGEENALLNKIQLLRLEVDSVISNQANKFLTEIASRYGIQSPEVVLKRKGIRTFIQNLLKHMKS